MGYLSVSVKTNADGTLKYDRTSKDPDIKNDVAVPVPVLNGTTRDRGISPGDV